MINKTLPECILMVIYLHFFGGTIRVNNTRRQSVFRGGRTDRGGWLIKEQLLVESFLAKKLYWTPVFVCSAGVNEL